MLRHRSTFTSQNPDHVSQTLKPIPTLKQWISVSTMKARRMVSMVNTIFAIATAMDASACSIAYYKPQGFYLERGADVPAAVAVIHLPSNAEGPLFYTPNAGTRRPPAASFFRMIDVGTGKRMSLRIAVMPSETGGIYRVIPVAGFVQEHTYTLSTPGKHTVNSPYHPSARLEIDAPLAWPLPTGSIRITSTRTGNDSFKANLVSTALEGRLTRYRDQISSELHVSPPPSNAEVIPSPCYSSEYVEFQTDAACHTVTAIVRFPALSSHDAIVSGQSQPTCPTTPSAQPTPTRNTQDDSHQPSG
jgi:hypothetical protein